MDADVTVVDEAPMTHRYVLEALDGTLNDLMSTTEGQIGGKILVLEGDFRQCLDGVKRASRAHIVNICIFRSKIWPNIKLLKLTENLRVKFGSGT